MPGHRGGHPDRYPDKGENYQQVEDALPYVHLGHSNNVACFSTDRYEKLSTFVVAVNR
jgi:hypothetical protein